MPSAHRIAIALFKENKNKPLHYREITKKILEHGMSDLGDRGGETPEQTMGAILRKNREFVRCGKGMYKMRTPS